MNEFTKKQVYSISIFGTLLSILVCSITLFFEPSFNIFWLIGTCIYFLILEIGVILYVINVSKKAKRDTKLVNAYMLTKVVKILLSLFIIAYYLLSIKTNTKAYLVVFASLYLSYLIIESVLFIKIEKHLKNETNGQSLS